MTRLLASKVHTSDRCAINRFLVPFESMTFVIVAICTTAQWLVFAGTLRALRSG